VKLVTAFGENAFSSGERNAFGPSIAREGDDRRADTALAGRLEGGGTLDLVTALLTATTSAGATYVVAKARRQRARRSAVRRRLGASVDLPLDTRHLSPRLAELTMSARTARLMLETPLVRFEEGLVRDTPWRMRERLMGYDSALADARLALWQWLLALQMLDEAERTLLRRLGLDPRPLWVAIYRPGVFDRTPDPFDESLYPVEPDLELVTQELCAAMDRLRSFEVALLSHRPDPYR
jgi:hypothetical protein